MLYGMELYGMEDVMSTSLFWFSIEFEMNVSVVCMLYGVVYITAFILRVQAKWWWECVAWNEEHGYWTRNFVIVKKVPLT